VDIDAAGPSSGVLIAGGSAAERQALPGLLTQALAQHRFYGRAGDALT
jgi:hypothetical protein